MPPSSAARGAGSGTGALNSHLMKPRVRERIARGDGLIVLDLLEAASSSDCSSAPRPAFCSRRCLPRRSADEMLAGPLAGPARASAGQSPGRLP